ncbi:MAG: hypothetical protein E6G97_21845 [Alphaproteobacteria bacterium]|nr:MAG: hypothetical protein E6G97_21845 [Alphaproteobacteria bacterium]
MSFGQTAKSSRCCYAYLPMPESLKQTMALRQPFANLLLFAPVTIVLAAVTLVPAFSASLKVDAQPFCAKPLTTPLTPKELEILDGLSAPSNVKRGNVALWPTLYIPVVFHQSLNASAKKSFKSAAKHVNDIGGINLVECDASVVEDKQVDGYMVIAELKIAGCKDQAVACSVGMGFKKKNQLGGLKPANALLAGGRPVGLTLPSAESQAIEDTVAHELMHALGAKHQHQHPAAGDYIEVNFDAKNERAAGNCPMEGGSNSNSVQGLWINRYDPGSIMHYELDKQRQCGIMLKGCKLTKTDVKDIKKVSACKVEEILAEGYPCAYKGSAGTPIKGTKCFRLPTSLRYEERYGSSSYDVNSKNCLSIVDQAWLRAAYSRMDEDKFKLKDRVTAGTCRAF